MCPQKAQGETRINRKKNNGPQLIFQFYKKVY